MEGMELRTEFIPIPSSVASPITTEVTGEVAGLHEGDVSTRQ